MIMIKDSKVHEYNIGQPVSAYSIHSGGEKKLSSQYRNILRTQLYQYSSAKYCIIIIIFLKVHSQRNHLVLVPFEIR